MRVISGKYKGKKLEGFNIDGTRPTMDRVKESLFSMIQNKVSGSVCLDLFAGSGALGIEALSMGANKCYFVDKNYTIFKILEGNTKELDGAILIKDNYKKAIDKIDEKLDIVFLDPPYKNNFITSSIKYLIENDKLAFDAIIVCEYETEEIDCDLELIKEKKYGSKRIKIYKNS